MYKTSSILDIKGDFINTLKKCKFIDLDQYRNLPWYKKVMALFLRVFAPLM
jgi:cardiolipin synthase